MKPYKGTKYKTVDDRYADGWAYNPTTRRWIKVACQEKKDAIEALPALLVSRRFHSLSLKPRPGYLVSLYLECLSSRLAITSSIALPLEFASTTLHSDERECVSCWTVR